MRQILVTTWLLAALGGSACAQTKVIVVNTGGNRPSETKFKHFVSDLHGVVLDGSNASTFSITQARINADLIEDALAAGFSVALPPDRIAIADDDNDQIDIKWPEVFGLALIGTGLTERMVRTTTNGTGIGPADRASTLVHVDNPDRAEYDECMLEYPGFGGEIKCCFDGTLSYLGGNDTGPTYGGSTTALYKFYNDQNAAVAIRFVTTPTSPPGSKVQATAWIANCQVGCQFAPGSFETHTDHMEWGWLGFRYVKYHYQVLNAQSMDHHINMYTNSGSPSEVAFDFQKGGDLLVDYAYAPNGTLLRIGEDVATNQGDFRFTKIRLDAITATGANTILLDHRETGSHVSVRMGGLIAASQGFDSRQMFRTKSGTGRLDLQVDIANMFSERAAYPIRPIKGQAVDDYYTTSAFPATTKLWFDPNDRASGWTIAESVINGLTVEEVEAAGDLSGTQVFEEQSTTGPTLIRDGCNWRDVIERNSSPLWTDGAPAELTNISDITVMALVHCISVSGTNVIISQEDTGGSDTSGWQLRKVDDKIVFRVGAASVPSNNSIEAFHWYLIIARRDGATGNLYVTVDGVTSADTGNISGTIANPTGPLVIGAQTASGTAANWWSRKLGPIFIDLASWETYFDGTAVTATTNAAGTTLTVTNYTPTSADIGKRLTILGGTNFDKRQVVVTNFTSTTLTVSADCSTATSATGMVGRLESSEQVERVNYLRQWGVW